MKTNMENIEKYTDQDLEKIASLISGETIKEDDLLRKFRTDDHLNTELKWNEVGKMGKDKNINVDKAWGNIYSKLEENGLLPENETSNYSLFRRPLMRIAASVLVILGIGAGILYLNNRNFTSAETVIATDGSQRNTEVTLPDGSKVFLNRNSKLTFNKDTQNFNRKVTLNGEAFFDVKHDPSNSFIIDAGNASVKVLGTTFSVMTSNARNEVEVYVKTGRVMLSNEAGTQNLTLEPDFIGTVDKNSSIKILNQNPNYLSWYTDLLVYDGKKLDVVFADMKRVFNIDIVADNPEILNKSITTTFEKEPEETIIRIICSTFNFSYRKEGSVYHLSK